MRGTTVAISNEDLELIHKICERDDRTVKAVVKIALRQYFEVQKVK